MEIAYPIACGMPRTSSRPCAMIEPSRAKKMKVKVAKMTLVTTDP